jgi:hypothetical protein
MPAGSAAMSIRNGKPLGYIDQTNCPPVGDLLGKPIVGARHLNQSALSLAQRRFAIASPEMRDLYYTLDAGASFRHGPLGNRAPRPKAPGTGLIRPCRPPSEATRRRSSASPFLPRIAPWELVAVSYETAFDEFRGILGNAMAMKSYRDGTLPFPDAANRWMRHSIGHASLATKPM